MNRPVPIPRVLLLATIVVVLVPASATGQEAGWPGLQGGPAHLGVASPPVPPPLQVGWHLRLPGKGDRGLSAAAVAEGFGSSGLGVVTGRNRVVAFDLLTGSIRWTKPRARGSLMAPAIASVGPEARTVVVPEGSGASNSAVLGLDLQTGERRWRMAVRQPVVAAPAVEGGVVYVGGQDRFVYAIDAATGKPRWRRPALGPVFAAPAVAGGKVFVVSDDPTTSQIRLVALAADSGKRAWVFEAQGGARLGSSAPTVAGDTVYVGLGDSVLAIRLATGKELWSSPIPAPFSPVTALAISGRDLFVADGEGALYRFDARTGERTWDFQFDQAQSASAPLVDDRFVLVGLDDGDVAAVDITNGDLRWRGAFGSGPVGALAPAGSVILVPLQGRGGGLVALENDPSGTLVRVESPTVLHPTEALVNFAAAFALVLLVLIGAFRFVPRLRPPPEGEVP